MRRKRPGSLEGYWFRETQPFLCRECRRICHRFRRRARQRPASTRPVRARRQVLDGKPSIASQATPLRERRLSDATACAGLMPAAGLTLRPRSHRYQPATSFRYASRCPILRCAASSPKIG
jgi:hypothetical protein